MCLQAAFMKAAFHLLKSPSDNSGWIARMGVCQLLLLLARGFVLGNRQFKDNLQTVWQHISGRDAALVLLYDVFGYGQAQARAIAGATAVCTKESRKDVWQLGFINAWAVVGDVDQQFLSMQTAIDVDHTALGAVFDGIAQDIVKSLIQITLIGTDDDGFVARLQL